MSAILLLIACEVVAAGLAPQLGALSGPARESATKTAFEQLANNVSVAVEYYPGGSRTATYYAPASGACGGISHGDAEIDGCYGLYADGDGLKLAGLRKSYNLGTRALRRSKAYVPLPEDLGTLSRTLWSYAVPVPVDLDDDSDVGDDDAAGIDAYETWDIIDDLGLPAVDTTGDGDRVFLVIHADGLRLLWFGLLDKPIDLITAVYPQKTDWVRPFKESLKKNNYVDNPTVIESMIVALDANFRSPPEVLAICPVDSEGEETIQIAETGGEMRRLTKEEDAIFLRHAVVVFKRMDSERRNAILEVENPFAACTAVTSTMLSEYVAGFQTLDASGKAEARLHLQRSDVFATPAIRYAAARAFCAINSRKGHKAKATVKKATTKEAVCPLLSDRWLDADAADDFKREQFAEALGAVAGECAETFGVDASGVIVVDKKAFAETVNLEFTTVTVQYSLPQRVQQALHRAGKAISTAHLGNNFGYYPNSATQLRFKKENFGYLLDAVRTTTGPDPRLKGAALSPRLLVEALLFQDTKSTASRMMTLVACPTVVSFKLDETFDLKLVRAGAFNADTKVSVIGSSDAENVGFVKGVVLSGVGDGSFSEQDIVTVSVVSAKTGLKYVGDDVEIAELAVLVEFASAKAADQVFVRGIVDWTASRVWENKLAINFDGVIVERVHSKSHWWLKKGEATSFGLRPEILGAEQTTLAVVLAMIVPGSDDWENLTPHGNSVDLFDEVEGLRYAPFPYVRDGIDGVVKFSLIWSPDQKGAASFGGTGGPIDQLSPDPYSFLGVRDFAKPHQDIVVHYRWISELYKSSELTDQERALEAKVDVLGFARMYLGYGSTLVNLLKLWTSAGHAAREMPGVLANLNAGEMLIATVEKGVPRVTQGGQDFERMKYDRTTAMCVDQIVEAGQMLVKFGKAGGKINSVLIGINTQIVNEAGKKPLTHFKTFASKAGKAILAAQTKWASTKGTGGFEAEAEEYLKLARLVKTNAVGLKSVWDAVLDGRYTSSDLKLVPKEFASTVRALAAEAEATRGRIEALGFTVRPSVVAVPVDMDQIKVAMRLTAQAFDYFVRREGDDEALENAAFDDMAHVSVTRDKHKKDGCGWADDGPGRVPHIRWSLGDILHVDELKKYNGANGFYGIAHPSGWRRGDKYRPCALHVVTLRSVGTVFTRLITLSQVIDMKEKLTVTNEFKEKLKSVGALAIKGQYSKGKYAQLHIRQMDGVCVRSKLLPLEVSEIFPEEKGTRTKVRQLQIILRALVPVLTECYDPTYYYGKTPEVLSDAVDLMTKVFFTHLFDTTFTAFIDKSGNLRPTKTLSLIGMSQHFPALHRHLLGRVGCESAEVFEKKHCELKAFYQRHTLHGAVIPGRMNQHEETITGVNAATIARNSGADMERARKRGAAKQKKRRKKTGDTLAEALAVSKVILACANDGASWDVVSEPLADSSLYGTVSYKTPPSAYNNEWCTDEMRGAYTTHARYNEVMSKMEYSTSVAGVAVVVPFYDSLNNVDVDMDDSVGDDPLNGLEERETTDPTGNAIRVTDDPVDDDVPMDDARERERVVTMLHKMAMASKSCDESKAWELVKAAVETDGGLEALFPDMDLAAVALVDDLDTLLERARAGLDPNPTLEPAGGADETCASPCADDDDEEDEEEGEEEDGDDDGEEEDDDETPLEDQSFDELKATMAERNRGRHRKSTPRVLNGYGDESLLLRRLQDDDIAVAAIRAAAAES